MAQNMFNNNNNNNNDNNNKNTYTVEFNVVDEMKRYMV